MAKNDFSKNEDIKKVETSRKTQTPADKTSNMDRLNKNDSKIL